MKKLVYVFLLLCTVSFLPTFASDTWEQTEQFAEVVHEVTSSGGQNIDISYPVFWIENIDNSVKEFISEQKISFAQASDFSLSGAIDLPQDYPLSLDVSYVLNTDSQNYISLVFHSYQFTGWAHGISLVKTLNYNIKTGKEIQLTLTENTLKKLSKVAYGALWKYFWENGGIVDTSWLKDGTAPTQENFENFDFHIGENGKVQSLNFYFQDYQVGPHALWMPTLTLSADGGVSVNTP